MTMANTQDDPFGRFRRRTRSADGTKVALGWRRYMPPEPDPGISRKRIKDKPPLLAGTPFAAPAQQLPRGTDEERDRNVRKARRQGPKPRRSR